MNSNGWKWQALTPALLGAGLMVLLYIAQQQNVLAEKVTTALLQLKVHQTVLEQNGLMTHRPREGG